MKDPVAMSHAGAQIVVSKYHFPLKEFSALWENV